VLPSVRRKRSSRKSLDCCAGRLFFDTSAPEHRSTRQAGGNNQPKEAAVAAVVLGATDSSRSLGNKTLRRKSRKKRKKTRRRVGTRRLLAYRRLSTGRKNYSALPPSLCRRMMAAKRACGGNGLRTERRRQGYRLRFLHILNIKFIHD